MHIERFELVPIGHDDKRVRAFRYFVGILTKNDGFHVYARMFMREAASVDIIRWIINQGSIVRVYDPVATETGREALEHAGVHMESVVFCQNAYEVAEGTDALVIVTEWNEFKSLDMHRIKKAMRNPILIDGRNIYEA